MYLPNILGPHTDLILNNLILFRRSVNSYRHCKNFPEGNSNLIIFYTKTWENSWKPFYPREPAFGVKKLLLLIVISNTFGI